ncbi:hypothetical protein QTP88_008867 [Uroleucon formosanum]
MVKRMRSICKRALIVYTIRAYNIILLCVRKKRKKKRDPCLFSAYTINHNVYALMAAAMLTKPNPDDKPAGPVHKLSDVPYDRRVIRSSPKAVVRVADLS